jgi:hypothetical protein
VPSAVRKLRFPSSPVAPALSIAAIASPPIARHVVAAVAAVVVAVLATEAAAVTVGQVATKQESLLT